MIRDGKHGNKPECSFARFDPDITWVSWEYAAHRFNVTKRTVERLKETGLIRSRVVVDSVPRPESSPGGYHAGPSVARRRLQVCEEDMIRWADNTTGRGNPLCLSKG